MSKVDEIPYDHNPDFIEKWKQANNMQPDTSFNPRTLPGFIGEGVTTTGVNLEKVKDDLIAKCRICWEKLASERFKNVNFCKYIGPNAVQIKIGRGRNNLSVHKDFGPYQFTFEGAREYLKHIEARIVAGEYDQAIKAYIVRKQAIMEDVRAQRGK